MPPPSWRPEDPATSLPGTGPAIRNPTAPASMAARYLRRRWMVPATNISSCRTSTMRPLMSAAWAANSSGVPRPRSTTSAVEAAGRRCHAAHQRLAEDPGVCRARSATPRAATSRRKERGSIGPRRRLPPVPERSRGQRRAVHLSFRQGVRHTRRWPQSPARADGRRRSPCAGQGLRSCQCPQVSRLLSLSDSSVRKAWVRIEGSRSRVKKAPIS